MLSSLILALALVAPATLPSSPSSARASELLASIDVTAPEAPSFILHATIPLPEGEFEGGPGLLPFGIVSHDAAHTVIDAQIAGVSRYPNGDWDVVQVLARVERGASEEPGELLRFEVVRQPHRKTGPHPPSRLLAGLLARGNSVLLRCRDVYGHEYELDLLARSKAPGAPTWRHRKQGAYLNQFRTAGVMLPREDEHTAARAGAALPHMMGVLAWFGDWQGEETLQLDLRVHNGCTGSSSGFDLGEEPLGLIYWQSLELVVPIGVTVVPQVVDPFFGEPYLDGPLRVYPIVAPFDDGELHMMPPQAQFLRRLVLVRDGDEALARARLDHAGLGFCVPNVERWSWSNPATARYFPQREELPGGDSRLRHRTRSEQQLHQQAQLDLSQLREGLELAASATAPGHRSALGWAQPYPLALDLPTSPAAAAKEAPTLLEGVRAVSAASVLDYARLELVHGMNLSRQPQALWRATGAPASVFELSVEHKGVRIIPFETSTQDLTTLPFFKLPALGGPKASAQARAVAQRGARPPYDRGTPLRKGGKLPRGKHNILSWRPYVGAQLASFTNNAKALVWLGDDPSAADDLELCAELFRLSFHEFASPTDARDPAAGEQDPPAGDYDPVTLAQFEHEVEQHPHRGLALDASHALGIDAFCANYSIATPEWRAAQLPWAERVADLLLEGAAPSGILMRGDYLPQLENPRYLGADATQSQLLMLAERSLLESVFRGVDSARRAKLIALYLRTTEYLFWGPVWQRVQAPDSQGDEPLFSSGLRQAFPVARNDHDQLPPFSDVKYWGRGYLPRNGFDGGVETLLGYTTLSAAADWTQATSGRGLRNRYLKRTLDYGLGAPDFDALLEQLTAPDRRVEDSAGLIARLRRWRRAP